MLLQQQTTKHLDKQHQTCHNLLVLARAKQPQPTEQMRQLQDKQQRPGSNTPSMGKKDFQPLTPRSEPISGETTKRSVNQVN